MNSNYAIAFGDLNVDWTATGALPMSWPELTDNGATLLHEISESPGGGAFTFARAARRAGVNATVVAAVGQDLAGDWLASNVEEIGANAAIAKISGKCTGRCFIARDARDVRFLVNSLGNANHYLDMTYVECQRDHILGASVVHVPGFCLRDATMPRYAAVKQVFDWVADSTSETALVFDVVPHRLYELMNWEEFRAMCRPVQLLISELSTMRRFLGLGNRSEVVTREMAAETLERLKPFFPCIVLRFGPSGCDEELRWDGRTAKMEHIADTGHAAATEKRGMGDYLTITALRDFFKIL